MEEWAEIIIATILLSIAIDFAVFGVEILKDAKKFFSATILFSLGIGSGFAFHELAHKYVALKYNYKARFFLFPVGILFCLITALFLGVIIALPGAVIILSQKRNKQHEGIIALAGPMMNLFLAILFFWISSINSLYFFGMNAWKLFAKFNIWLGLLNLLPFSILDGKKIKEWNSGIWLVSIFLFAYLFFFT